MDVYEATVKRRSIRRFHNDPIPYEILERCIDAARMAPNGHNHQILEFIIVDDETSDSVERWKDDQGVLHVPKRRLADILHRNKFK